MFGLVWLNSVHVFAEKKSSQKFVILYIYIVYMCFFFFENVPLVINFVKLLLYSFPRANKFTIRVTVVQSVVQF